MNIIPLRGGQRSLALEYSLVELMEHHNDVNRVLEEAWAGLLGILVRNWPDWPIELWSRLEEIETDDDANPILYVVGFRLSFCGEGPDNSDVTAMLDMITRGLRAVLKVEPDLDWASIDPTFLPLWAIDDAVVYRLLAPEATVEDSIYLIGTYAGEPRLFASTLEAWPLRHARLQVKFAGVDLGWAFSA